MDIDELNEALLWLAERQGKITFGVNLENRLNDVQLPAPVVAVEAMSATEEEVEQGKQDWNPCLGTAQIDAGNAVGALLAAINAARSDNG
jgi:hypothetical protein